MEDQIEKLKRISFIRGSLQAMAKVMARFAEKGLINKGTTEVLREIFQDYQNQYDDESDAETSGNQ